jgi:Variant SH3 domain
MAEHADGASYDAIVTKDYAAQYSDPITLAQGEAAALDGRAEPWEENPDWIWVWGENARGKSGWIPRPLLRVDGSRGVALEDYDAHELSVAAGERVSAWREACGWAWCVADANRSGWVPLSHLRRAS